MKSLLILIALCFLGTVFGDKIINCYYGTWARYRPGNGKFEPNHIDPKLCTHLSYSFFGINDQGELIILDTNSDIHKGGIAESVALKRKNPNLKVLAVVGGWNEGSAKYSAMAADHKKRRNFVISVLKFIRTHDFDGIDLDWEYPAQRDGNSEDRKNFVTLLRTMRSFFKTQNLLIGIAVGASKQSASISYDIPEIVKYVDFINIMTYDYEGPWANKLGFNAPLRGHGENNVEASIKYWLAQGAPAEKLVMGIAFYGHAFTIADSTEPGAPMASVGNAGKYTRQAGMLGYNEICGDIESWNVKRDETAAVPYAHKGNQWISYDDAESIAEKMEFLKSMNLRGAMVWSIETDDFRGVCGKRYPLLNTINEALLGNSDDNSSVDIKMNDDSGSDVDSNSVVDYSNEDNANEIGNEDNDDNVDTDNVDTNNVDTDNVDTGAEFVCKEDGLFANPSDCGRYIQCGNGRSYDMSCSDGLFFDPKIGVCNWPAEVKCGVDGSSKSVATTTEFVCESDGLFANPSDCGRYIQCANGRSYDMPCSQGLLFDPKVGVCNWPAEVECNV